MRIGMGYDVHRLVRGRPLVMGGVHIPSDRGLDGHSDADVLLHAVCDALLGAAGLDDIGSHFPDSDHRYENISSLLLMRESYGLVRDAGFRLVNMDATIIAQAPRIDPYRQAMRDAIAQGLDEPPERINIKATTTEKLGFAGREEGIAAMCVALIEQNRE